MSAENEKIKPKTDFELFLNYANQCVWKNLENDSGAGANAASRVDMTFAATDPLSEIVWSPDKGLSLKCADSSFADKNTSLFRDIGPSNIVLAPPQSVTGGISTTDKPIDDVFVKPIAVICTQSDTAASDSPAAHPTSDSAVMPESKAYEENNIGSGGNMEKMNTAERAPNFPNDQKEDLMNDWEKNICDQANIGIAKTSGIKFSAISGPVDQRPFNNLLFQADEPKPSMEQNPSPRKHSNAGIDVGIGKKAVVTDDTLYTRVEPIIEYKGSGAPGTNLTSSSRSPLEKLESTAENDLRTFHCEAACAATSRVLFSKCNEIKTKSQDNEMMLLRGKILPALHSPCNSRIHMTMNKGKEKSLSDGDANLRLSKEENNSNSSVESCNSAGIFSTGKKRHNFQQQLIIGSKRVKKQTQGTSGAKSYVKQDSSFMNWISNMVKGLSQPIQDDSNSLAVTLANQDRHIVRPDQEHISCNKNQDPEPKIVGFKSIFQSIYCPGLKNAGTSMFHVGEGCKDVELGNRVHGLDATPITCCAENNSLCKHQLQSNKFEVCAGKYDAGPFSQPTIKPLNFFNCHENSKNNPVENKNCSNMGLSKDKEGMTSHSTSTRQNTNNTENVDSYALSERKEADNICLKSDTLGSQWITRFSPKSISPLIFSDHLNETDGSQAHFTDCSKLPNSHKHISYLNNCKIEETREQSADDQMLSEAKELQNCWINTEASTGLKDDKVNKGHKSKHKLNPISSSPGFRDSEPMASMFARRLGAIKHIIPTDRTDSPAQVNMTCLFCGTRGHQLCDCLEIGESELEDLLKNINSYGGLEEPPCLCIKCFQPNHWAISCPASISRRKHELETNVLVSDCIPTGKHFSPGNEGSARLLTGEDDQILCGGSINDGTDHKAERSGNLKWKSKEIITSMIGCNASFKKYSGSSSEENKLKENPMTSPSSSAERHISHIPDSIFDAVNKLRLSRTDILKWINSHESVSQLDGFFLRLRLGKWEEGLGGTGYHVASVNEAQRQSSEQNTSKSLYVNVGGIKCMVESQYISNHDFLEEEIMEWWSTTTKAGVEIPSAEDLIEKIENKRRLGF